jgi:hypothetical protein
MSTVASKRQGVPAKVKIAVEYLIEVSSDLKAAAAHAGIHLHELRRSLSRPECRRYALQQRQLALEAFCLRSPAVLTKVVDEGENSMAIVAAVKCAEQLRTGALEAEAAAQKRQPGLSIVIMPALGATGEPRVAFQPPQPRPMLSIEGAAAPAMPEPVPANTSDVEAE